MLLIRPFECVSISTAPIWFHFCFKKIKYDGYSQVIYSGQDWLPLCKPYLKTDFRLILLGVVFSYEKRAKIAC